MRVEGKFTPPNEFLISSPSRLPYSEGMYDHSPREFLKDLIQDVKIVKQFNGRIFELYRNLSTEARKEVNKVLPKKEHFFTLYDLGILE